MIRFILIAVAFFSLVLFAGWKAYTHQQAKIISMAQSVESLEAQVISAVEARKLLEDVVAVERKTAAEHLKKAQQRAKDLQSKLNKIEDSANEDWLNSDMPTGADSLLGKSMQTGDKDSASESTTGISKAHSGAPVGKNKDHLRYTLYLEDALRACNEDKASALENWERIHAKSTG